MSFRPRFLILGLLAVAGQAAADPIDIKGPPGKARLNRFTRPDIAGKAPALPVPARANALGGNPGQPAARPPSALSTPAAPTAPGASASTAKPQPASATTTTSAATLEALLPGEKAATECVKLNPNKKYKWDQRGEIDLAALLAWAQSSFCLPLIVPANLRQQKVTIYAPNTMTPAEMYRMFLSALNAMGLTVQPHGSKDRPSALMIIESTRAKEAAIPTLGPGETVPTNDAFVTKVHRLEHIGTEDVLPILTRIKSQAGDVIAAPPSTLIITEVAENVNRMMEILGMLDLPMGGEQIWLVKLVNVGAGEMVNILQQVFMPKGTAPAAAAAPRRVKAALKTSAPTPPPAGGDDDGAGGGDQSVSQIIAEERTNSIIIVATQRAYQRILGLVQRLDQMGGPLDTSSDRVHVYFLANANAEDMAATLTSLGVSASGGASRSATGTSSAGRRPTGGAPPSSSGTPLFESEVRVAADKPTNSLVIVASGKDYLTLRDLIRRLDIARRQVFIEATILEVSLDKARKLGVSFHFGDTVSTGGKQSLVFGGMEPNSSVNSIAFSPAALSGLAAGLRGPSIPGAAEILGLPAGTSVPAFGVYIQALQNNNDVNVISLPHILTSDNEKATIQVGQNLPFPGQLSAMPTTSSSGTSSTSGYSFGVGTSVQRQDVALKLDVTPHVNDSDFVRLEVENEISDVTSQNYNGLGPATSKRHVKTVVVVRDQQSVVLGGLIKDRVSETVDKVPFLGDIPILGYLFKFTNKSVTKQNLLIVLTPYVIKDPLDLRRIFERKIAERKEFLERYAAFKDPNVYEAHVNYARKRGLLEEINQTAIEAEQEAVELRRAEESMRRRILQGPVEPAPLTFAPSSSTGDENEPPGAPASAGNETPASPSATTGALPPVPAATGTLPPTNQHSAATEGTPLPASEPPAKRPQGGREE